MSGRSGNLSTVAVLAACVAAATALLPGCKQVTPPPQERTAGDCFAAGMAHQNRGEHAQAVAAFTEAVTLDPNHAQACNARGVSYARQGQGDKAIRDYTRAIELSPALAEAYRNRAAAYLQNGEYDKAWADVKACRDLGEQVAEALVASLRKASGGGGK